MTSNKSQYPKLLTIVILKTIFFRVTHSFITKRHNHAIPTLYSSPLSTELIKPLIQVISDVDDTLKSSGGLKIGDIALGGIDTQYERDDVYPGVMQFLFEVSLFSTVLNQPFFSISPPKVAILTARAEEFKAALELKDDSKLGRAFISTGQKAGISNWGLGPVLYGSVAEWIVQDRKGLRKFSNFERLMQQDSSGRILQYIYVGDTGELDLEAGETMLYEYPDLVQAVFLHVVSESPRPSIPSPRLINGRPIFFFRTYIGAAVMACQWGLIDTDGMMRVAASAQDELIDVDKSSDKWDDLYQDLMEADKTFKAFSR